MRYASLVTLAYVNQNPCFFFLSGEKSELTLVNTFINNVIFSIRLVFFFPLLELYVTGVDRLEGGSARKHADKQGGRH